MTHSEMIGVVDAHLENAKRSLARWEAAVFTCDGKPTGYKRARVARGSAVRAVRRLEIMRALLAGHRLTAKSLTDVFLGVFDEGKRHTTETITRRLFKAHPGPCWEYEEWVEKQLRALAQNGRVWQCRNKRRQRAWQVVTPAVKAEWAETERKAEEEKKAFATKMARFEAINDAFLKLGIDLNIDARWSDDVELSIEEAEKVAKMINGVMAAVGK